MCMKHFPEERIVREDRWEDKDGKIHYIPRANPCLKLDAFPTIISIDKPHLSFPLPRKEEQERTKKMNISKQPLK